MDSDKSTIRQSLQEIAKLLYYMYEHYLLKDDHPDNATDGLVLFLGDLGLLGNKISVLECEAARLSTNDTSSADSGGAMSYEQFYAWLRGIACFLYYDLVGCARKSLHILLTERIIPLASSWEVLTFSSKFDNRVKGALLGGMQLFHGFLRLWYFHLHENIKAPQRLCTLTHVWRVVVQDNLVLPVDVLLRAFQNTGITDRVVNAEQLMHCSSILASIGATREADNTDGVLTFSDFLQILGFAASSVESPPTASSPSSYHHGLHAILQAAAEYLLHRALDSWKTYESNDSLSVGLSPKLLLWVCRQGGLIQGPSYLCALSDVFQQAAAGGAQALVPVSRVPGTLSTVCASNDGGVRVDCPGDYGPATGQLIHGSSAADYYTQCLIGSSDIAVDASVIAMRFPTLLFACPQPIPSLIEDLYSTRGARVLRDLDEPMGRILRRMTSIKADDRVLSSMPPDYSGFCLTEEKRNVYFNPLVDLLTEAGIVPHFAQLDVVISTASYVLSRDVCYQETIADAEKLSMREAMEVIFGVAQVVFGGVGEEFSPSPDCILLSRLTKDDEEGTWTALAPETSMHLSDGYHSHVITQFAVEDRVHRLCLLLEICDPMTVDRPIMDRITIRQFEESKVDPNSNHGISNDSEREVVAVENFSSDLCNILNSLLTAANLCAFRRTDISKSLKHIDMSFTQQVVVLLLLHFPVNSLSLTPWDLTDLISDPAKSRHDITYLTDANKEFAGLQLDFRYICTSFKIGAKELELFLRHALSPTSDSDDVRSILEKLMDMIDGMFTFSNLTLMREGSFLFLWEYLRCLRGNYFTRKSMSTLQGVRRNPFLEDVVTPFPSRAVLLDRASDMQISQRAAVEWAIGHEWEKERCEELFIMITTLSGVSTLTFSSFIVFVLLCCFSTSESSEEGKRRQLTDLFDRVSSSIELLESNSVDGIFSGILGEGEPSLEEIVEFSMTNFYNTLPLTATKRATSSVGFMKVPPRPALELWDAPRFVHFCKCSGVTGTLVSLSIAWSAFRKALVDAFPPSRLQEWGDSVIPPLTTSMDPASLLNLLGHLQLSIPHNSCPSSSVRVLHTSIIPCLAGAADDELPPTRSPGKGKYVPLEDLLRYGGHRVIAALNREYKWMLDTYKALGNCSPCALNGEKEPLLFDVCRYIVSSSAFTLGTASVLMKASLCSRIRGTYKLSQPSFLNESQDQYTVQSNVQPPSAENDIGISLTEFEELLIRCAYSLWESVGALHKDCSKTELFDAVKKACPTMMDSSVSIYCEAYRSSLGHNQPTLQSNSRESSADTLFRTRNADGAGSTWGMDYMSPLISLLKEAAIIPKRVSVQVSSSVRMLPKMLLSPTTVGQSAKLAPHGDSLSPATIQHRTSLSPDFNMSKLSSLTSTINESTFVSSTQDGDISDLLRTVETRSAEMLNKILAMRTQETNTSSITSASGNSVVFTGRSPPRMTGSSIRREVLDALKIDTRPPVSPPKGLLHSGESVLEVDTVKTTKDTACVQNDQILEGTKEALWPVFATYCSCGDSSDPGKLSGPNLFALLSKLDLLTDTTMLSDVGVLLHQISAHSLAQSPLHSNSAGDDQDGESTSPLLSFEEFLVFLCAFAQLRFEGTVQLPVFSPHTISLSLSREDSQHMSADKDEKWFVMWSKIMMESASFRRLLEECVLPPLRRSLVLASPDDARDRDEHSLMFSLDILFRIEACEKDMLILFEADQKQLKRLSSKHTAVGPVVVSPIRRGIPTRASLSQDDPIVAALTRIKIIPQIVSADEVQQLIADILPGGESAQKTASSTVFPYHRKLMRFPQWQWVICVIAFKAVMCSMRKSRSHEPVKNLSVLVGEVIATMVAAMAAQNT